MTQNAASVPLNKPPLRPYPTGRKKSTEKRKSYDLDSQLKMTKYAAEIRNRTLEVVQSVSETCDGEKKKHTKKGNRGLTA